MYGIINILNGSEFMKHKIFKLTKERKPLFLNQIADLEVRVLENMEKNGKTGQLFITGRDGIEEYVDSDNNTVMCAADENNKIQSVAYITQGQIPYTYNDITKYFKYGPEFEKDVRKLYGKNYKGHLLESYYSKIDAYKYAREKVLAEYPQYDDINEFLKHELKSKNGFDEKSELREKINKYMSEYIIQNGCMRDYELFYWSTSDDVAREIYRDRLRRNHSTKNSIMLEYDNFLRKSRLEIHEKNTDKLYKYFSANTLNSIEIDTYITDPDNRHAGLARILVFEGIKRHINKYFHGTNHTHLFLCSTLHKQNLSSKYVSEFFGLTDNLYVTRRNMIDREVHILRLEREAVYGYLQNIEDKLIVLYNYNPKGKVLSNSRKIQVLKEQLEYEFCQYRHLNKIRYENKDYTGKLTDIMPKLNKIGQLKRQIKELEQLDKGDDR